MTPRTALGPGYTSWGSACPAAAVVRTGHKALSAVRRTGRSPRRLRALWSPLPMWPKFLRLPACVGRLETGLAKTGVSYLIMPTLFLP